MNIRLLLANKKRLIIPVVSIVFLASIVGAFVLVENHKSKAEAQRIAAFEQEKAKKLSDIIAENKRLSENAAKKDQEAHESLQKLIESGDITTAKIQNDCKRLQNREAITILNTSTCAYKLKASGTARMAVVFITDNSGIDYSGDVATYKAGKTSKESLLYINEFLKKEAARKNNPVLTIDMDFYGPFQQTSPVTITNASADITDAQETINVLQNTSLQNKVAEANYDIVHYVYLPKNKFRSFALPDGHRAVTNAYSSNTPGIFIHETLHLFNASDKYNNGDCQTRGRGDPFDVNSAEKNLIDIMCDVYVDLDMLNINTITARELGWPN